MFAYVARLDPINYNHESFEGNMKYICVAYTHAAGGVWASSAASYVLEQPLLPFLNTGTLNNRKSCCFVL